MTATIATPTTIGHRFSTVLVLSLGIPYSVHLPIKIKPLLGLRTSPRLVRYLNVGIGLWLAVSPLLLSGATPALTLSSVLGGLALALLSLPRGLVRERYGTAQRLAR